MDQGSHILRAAIRSSKLSILALMQVTLLMSCSGPEISQAPLKSTKSEDKRTPEFKQGDGEKTEGPRSPFDGIWLGPCVTDDMSGQFVKTKVVITGSSLVKIQTYFYTSTCAPTTIALEVTSTNSFTLDTALNTTTGATAINRTVSSFSARPHTLAYLGFLNQNSICGGGFVLFQEKLVTQAQCEGDPLFGDQFLPIFDIIGVSDTDGKLYLGALDDVNNGRTIDLRPQYFDSYGYEKQP